MKEYDYDEVWSEIIKFVLRLRKHPKYRPQTVKEAKNMLRFIPEIRNVIRTIDDTDRYIEMITMADEVEELLQRELNELKSQK